MQERKNDPWLRKAVLGGAIGGAVKAAVYWAIVVGLPIAGPVVTIALAAYAPSGVPAFLVWVAALVAFAAATGALLLYDIWRQRKRVDGQLRAEIAAPGLDFSIINGRRAVTGAQARIAVTNKATFPISFVVDKVETRIVGHPHMYRENAKVLDRGAIVEGESGKAYASIPVDAPAGITADRFYIEVSFAMRYGRPENEKYPLKGNANIEISNPTGPAPVSATVFSGSSHAGAGSA